MFRYNEASFTSQFIQNLLRNTPTPIMPILTDTQNKNINKTSNFSYIYNKNFCSGNKIIEPYEFGKKYPNITDNYIPAQSYYSTELHEHLGNYLRNYSEYYKIDLMGLYNCFSNRLISNITLPLKQREESESEDVDSNVTDVWYDHSNVSDDYIITGFPIRVGSTYTIKVYGTVRGNITIQPAFYNGSTFIQVFKNKNDTTPVVFDHTNYGHVDTIQYTFNGDSSKIDYNKLLQNQKYLYLFIQVPVIENLRMSVVESNNFFNVVNNTLLNLPGDINYNVPFSDRLLEFLVGNVITREDPIKQNITRVQNFINIIKPKGVTFNEYTKGTNSNIAVPPYNNLASTGKKYMPIPGIYDDTLRVILYDYLSSRGIPDFTGYVDKDVEQILTKEAKVRTVYSKGNYPFQKSNER